MREEEIRDQLRRIMESESIDPALEDIRNEVNAEPQSLMSTFKWKTLDVVVNGRHWPFDVLEVVMDESKPVDPQPSQDPDRSWRDRPPLL